MKISIPFAFIAFLITGFILGGLYFENLYVKFVGKTELSDDYTVLIDDKFNPERITLHGISLNQSISGLNLSETFERDDGRSVHQTEFDDTAVISDNNKVHALVLKNDALEKSGLTSGNAIVSLLGEPDDFQDNEGFLDAYIYFDRKMILRVTDTNPFTEERMANPTVLLTIYR